MLKKGIFHPQLLRVLGELRHRDMIVIGDAGLPIPKSVERIDLGWKEGSPGYLEVLTALEEYLVIEEAIFANEALEVSKVINDQALAILPKSVQVQYIPHAQLKEISHQAKAIVLTGEFTGYTNVILVCGCAY